MKNLFIIIALALFQCACSTQAPQANPPTSLLSFTDLAGEITITRGASAATPVSSRTNDKDLGDSS